MSSVLPGQDSFVSQINPTTRIGNPIIRDTPTLVNDPLRQGMAADDRFARQHDAYGQSVLSESYA